MNALRHVLCVDDDPDILEIVKLSLELAGDLTISCCNSGACALEAVPRLFGRQMRVLFLHATQRILDRGITSRQPTG